MMAILTHLFQRLYHYARLMRLNRPIGTLLLLWPTLIALWLASNGAPSPKIVVIFTLGVIVMRAAGCVINDYADRHVDGHVQRTKARPIVNGDVAPREALGLFGALLCVAGLLVCCLDRQTILLSFVAVLLATAYPFMKRYTYYPQVVLGAAFGFAIPMAFSAEQAGLTPACWLLYAATLLWAVAYDTLYAIVDKEDDLKIGVKSTAIAFGHADKLMVWVFHMIMLGLIVILGVQTGRGVCFFLGIAVSFMLACYQQWLIKNNQKERFFKAFLNNHWLGFSLFAGTFIDFWL
jgi:4-hydroxybenzoate polyprenyltransferase